MRIDRDRAFYKFTKTYCEQFMHGSAGNFAQDSNMFKSADKFVNELWAKSKEIPLCMATSNFLFASVLTGCEATSEPEFIKMIHNDDENGDISAEYVPFSEEWKKLGEDEKTETAKKAWAFIVAIKEDVKYNEYYGVGK